jgi:hypothetical protein
MDEENEDVEALQADERLKQYQEEVELDAVRAVLSSPKGRAFVWSLLEYAGIYRTTFSGETPLTSAFHEGRRSVGLWAFEKVFTDGPDVYRMMAQESEDRERELRTRAESARD